MKRFLIYVLPLLGSASAWGQDVELVIPKNHVGSVTTLDLSEDGKFLLSAGLDNVIFLREARTGNYLREFDETDGIRVVRFLPGDRKFLVQTSRAIDIRDMLSTRAKQEIAGIFEGVKACRSRNEFLAVQDTAVMVFSEVNNEYQLVRTISTGVRRIRYCSYSQDEKKILVQDDSVKIFNVGDGKKMAVYLPVPNDSITSLALRSDGVTLAIGLITGKIKMFDLGKNMAIDSLTLYRSFWSGRYNKGIVRDSSAVTYPVQKLVYQADGTLISYHDTSPTDDALAANSAGQYVNPADLDRMWSNLQKELNGERVAPGKFITVWNTQHRTVKYLDFSTEATYPFAISNDFIATSHGIRNYATREKTTYDDVNSNVREIKFSLDGRNVVASVDYGKENTWVWNLPTGKNYTVSYRPMRSGPLVIHQNSLGVVDHTYDHGGLFDLEKGKLSVAFTGGGYGMTVNPVKDEIAVEDASGLSITNFPDGRVLYHRSYDDHLFSFSYSDDGGVFVNRNALFETKGYTFLDSLAFPPSFQGLPVFLTNTDRVLIWDYYGSIFVRNYRAHRNLDTVMFFYTDSADIVVRKNYHYVHDFRNNISQAAVTSIDVSPDEKTVAIAFDNGVIMLLDPVTWRPLTTLNSQSGNVTAMDFSPDNRYLISNGNDGSIRFWELKTGEVAFRILFYKDDWVVVNRDHLFDGSAGGLARLFFINGLQTIELNQLKARYYEPGLLKKITSGEKLRNVTGFNSVELPPEIKVGQVDSKGNLPIEVINRGGGIGEVTLLINGKEVVKDLRPQAQRAKGASMIFSVPISADRNLVAGSDNFIAVKGWNAGQWIESRGTVVKYVPPAKQEIKPAIYILSCGVSDYTGDEIDLKYAAKDAEQMAAALELGAHRLFGTEKSHLYVLTTQRKDQYPTKANIVKAFKDISSTASSSDVFVVYLSGHGINLGGSDGDFHYLAQDAFSASPGAYTDPAILKNTTLSSQELVELFKKVPALKQVLIIDACASGKVVDNLMAKRDIESGTLRALDRLKDRTGMHIITGCTADAVSYEASRYGQGVLTYSLLEGLRGLALREEKFVDVSQLFQFAQERVPVLASGIGGIQTPQVFSPNGSQSFDFGELTAEDKKQIRVLPARPVYIRSTFIDEQKLRDVLSLGKKMDDVLNEVSMRGEAAPLLFSDVSEYPDGCQLSGAYRQKPGAIELRLNKVCGGKETLYQLEAKDEKELIRKILEVLTP